MPFPGLNANPEQAPWVRLRRKTNTTVADPAWAVNHYDAAGPIIILGGTPSDGDYTVQVDPVNADLASVPITFNRASGETNAQILAGLTTEARALSREPAQSHSGDGELARYLDRGQHPDGLRIRDDGSILLFLPVKESAPPFTISVSPPGAGTLAVTPVDTFPITRTFSPYPKRQGTSNPTQLELVAVQVDSSGNPLPNGSTTVSIQPINVIARKLPTDDAQTYNRVFVGGAVSTPNHPVGQPLRVPFNGGQFGVELSALASPHASVAALELWVREVVE